MDIFLTVIAVIVIFSALVLIHELGHFIAARRAGIKVLEFGIGFPPRLWKKKVGETLYTVNAIPFGGFVKLYGEDVSDPSVLKDSRSFATKSPWVRTKVIVAGVLMNFLLAILLLTIGFSFGIEPLIVNEQDLVENIQSGVVKTSPGVFVAAVSDHVKQMQINVGDRVLAINDAPITQESQLMIFNKNGAKSDVDLSIENSKNGEVKKIHLPLVSGSLGVELKSYTFFPRLQIMEVKPLGASEKAGIRAGDIILRLNDKDIYSALDFAAQFDQKSPAVFTMLRGDTILTINVTLDDLRRVMIQNVSPGSAAEKAQIKANDVILQINKKPVYSVAEVQEYIQKSAGAELTYSILRAGKALDIKAKTGENNLLGVGLSKVDSYKNFDLTFFQQNVLTSITQIGKVSYGPWQAFKQSIVESYRLTGLTILAFGRTIGSIVGHLTVPGDVGGPVQIAYYTHAFVQEGIFALLRFMALLSLSLAVINILPIPALDGGRFLFIVLEVIFKKRVSAKVEAIVHGVGFIVLMGFIVLITISDITKLF